MKTKTIQTQVKVISNGETRRVPVVEKTPITERALFQRVKRYLEKEESKLLKKCRPSNYYSELADYYILDIHTNSIYDMGLSLADLEARAREWKVISKHETVVD